MPLLHTYRITQYDPRDRDPSGAYIGQVDNVSDEGPLEGPAPPVPRVTA